MVSTGPISHVSRSTLWIGLIHQRTAAIQLPGSAPRPAVIVLLRAIPFDVGVPHRQAAKAALVDRLLDQLRGFVKARREDGREHDAVLFALADHAIAARQGDFQRLFHDHVLSRPRGGQRRLQMSSAGRADRDDIDPFVGQHRLSGPRRPGSPSTRPVARRPGRRNRRKRPVWRSGCPRSPWHEN